MKLYLHVCCGPCSIIPLEDFIFKGYKPVCVYSNSNIFPFEEYNKRRNVFFDYAADLGIEVIEDAYESELWEAKVGIYGADREKRCKACYEFRFMRLAQIAASREEKTAIASSLTISPYQFTDVINEELAIAAQRYGLTCLESDFKARYHESVQKSKELDMYRQNYCGCRFSIDEAEASRREAKERKREAKPGGA